MITRRSILRSLLAAPMVVTTPGLLMPVRDSETDPILLLGRYARWETPSQYCYIITSQVIRRIGNGDTAKGFIAINREAMNIFKTACGGELQTQLSALNQSTMEHRFMPYPLHKALPPINL